MGLGLKQKAAGTLNAVKRLAGVGDYWYWLPAGRVDAEIPIAPLVYPLRYDILVRKSYFDFYAEHRDVYRSDFPAYLDLARRHEYHDWFTRVLMVRFESASVGDPERTTALFAARLRAAAELHDSIQVRGFDTDHPIVPHTAETVLPATSGVTLERRYFMGDGCHRLACLMSLGHATLPREFVRVKCFRRLAPLDNTALLAGTLDIAWPPGLVEEASG